MKMRNIVAIASAVSAVTALAVVFIVKHRKKLGLCCECDDFDMNFDDSCCECECCQDDDLDVTIPAEEYDDADVNLNAIDDEKPKDTSGEDSSDEVKEI